MRGSQVAARCGRGRGTRVALVVLLAGTLGGCWAQPGFGPLHQGFNPFEDDLTAANVATLDVAWTAQVDDGPVRSDPVVSGAGLVHVSDDEGVYGLAQSDGGRRWRRQVVPAGQPDAVVPGPVSTEGDRLHVAWGGAPDTGARLELDARTGALRRTAGGLGVEAITLRSPYVVTAFSGFIEGTLAGTGFGVEGGPRPWGVTLALEVAPKLRAPTGPAVTSTRLFVGIERSWFGTNILGGWDLDPGCATVPVPPQCTPQVTTQLDGLPTGPVVADDERTVYVGTDAGTLYAIDGATGAVRWRAALGSAIVQQPALTPSTVYVVTADGRLVTLAAGGCGPALCTPTGSTPVAGTPTRAPAVAGGVVYVASTGGTIEAFSATSPGAPLFTDDLGAEITGGPTIATGRLLLATATGQVVAYTPAPPPT